MTKFKAGDIFAFKLPTNEYMSGRIMLDVKQQCIRPKLLKPDSPLNFFNGSLLVEVYKLTSSEPTLHRSEVLIPGVFVSSNSLESGEWSIIGHEDVSPTEVEFPEAMVAHGLRAQFVKGEIALDIDLKEEDLERLNVYRTKKPSALLGEISLYYLGRADEINNPRLRDIELRSLKDSDLRFTEYRSDIYLLLGKDENQSYYEMSNRLGYDIRRFYQTN
ncbi:MAG: Imm26 family immunity protein [Nostoc sp. SerVER01]|nr:Imm26 family immunity protein [Nostoc sp. SerVER01]